MLPIRASGNRHDGRSGILPRLRVRPARGSTWRLAGDLTDVALSGKRIEKSFSITGEIDRSRAGDGLFDIGSLKGLVPMLRQDRKKPLLLVRAEFRCVGHRPNLPAAHQHQSLFGQRWQRICQIQPDQAGGSLAMFAAAFASPVR